MIRVLSRCFLILCLMLALFVVPSPAQEQAMEKAKEMAMDEATEMAMDKAAEMAGKEKEMPAHPAVASFEDCPGPVSTWRVNELTEGGSHEGFLEAARDHHAWLVKKGYPEVRIRTWVAFDPPEGGPADQGSPAQQVGFGSDVLYPSAAYASKVRSNRESDRDEAYDAFVAKYRENTVLKTTWLVCLSE